MNVLMLGNGFDLYHNLLTHYNDFMTIGEYLCNKYNLLMLCDKITVYSALDDLAKKNETIKKKLFVYKNAYDETEIEHDEYRSFISKLHENCWFKYFLYIKNRDGWVALETQVCEVLRKFRKSDFGGIDSFLNALKEKFCYNDVVFSNIKHCLFNEEKHNDYIFEQYNQFLDMLKQYLRIFVDNVLLHISDEYKLCNKHFRNKDYILTFNYTNTYAKLYDSNANIVHIHGNLNDEIILGVNSDEYDIANNDDVKYIKYKKYYQRITKHTLSGLSGFMNDISLNTYMQKELYIVGHSLDESDSDIITVLFELFDNIVIYYHNDNNLDKYVKNLKLIFGSNNLSKMTFSQRITFQKLPENEFMEMN